MVVNYFALIMPRISIKRFLQKTVIKVSGATLLALASLFIVNIGEAQASTVYGSTGSGVAENVNFATCTPLTACRVQQFYVSRGENLPVGLTFDRVQIITNSTTTAPRVNLYIPLDSGDPRTSCTDGSCVSDDTFGSFSESGSMTHKGDGVWEKTFTAQTISGTGYYFYIGIDPNASYQNITVNTASDGTLENGFNSSRQDGSFAYQLCNGQCDGFGTFSPISQNQLDGTYETKFLSATLSASGTLTAVVNYYIDTDDFVGQYDRPDVVLINISNLDTTQFESKQKLILPLSTGNASTTINLNNTIPDGEYSAQINFWNMFSQNFVLNRTYLTINFTVSGGSVITQAVVDSSDAIFPFSATAYEECGITNITGCINNSFRFLFYPSTESIDSFTTQYQAVQQKAPFVYVYQASDLLTSMYNGTAGSIPALTLETGIGDITLISEPQLAEIPYVSLLRTLIGYGLWLMLFTVLYRKTLSIHDKQTV